MNKTSILLLIAGVALLHGSCRKVVGEGPVVTENRTRENYAAISVRISGNVYYTPDSSYSLQIIAQQNILDILETPVVDDELVLRFRNNVNVKSDDGIIIRVSAPSVSSFSVNGSGNLQSSGVLTPSSMRLNVSGSGNLSLSDLVTPAIDATISGSGNITIINGSASDETVRISGSGSIDLSNLPVKTARSSSSGSGTTRLYVTESLDASISGSGNVYYKGNPRVTANVSGSGRIIPF